MDALAWEAEPPQLRSPVLVCAFAGWNDAAGSATTALTTAAESLDAEVIAQIDPEEFFDFQANRPTIRLTEGQTREIEWPGNVLLAATPAGAERDLVLLAGTEPNLRWRTFSDGIADAAEMLGVEMVVTLGALIADVAHTLPGADHRPRLRRGAGRAARPGALQLRGTDRGRRRAPRRLPAGAGSPRPASGPRCRTTSPRSPTRRRPWPCCAGSEGLVGVAVEASGLEEESESYESQVSRAVAANPEIEELVQRLEAEQAERLDVEDDVPSGESLARDFERYLRQQGGSPDA